MSSFEDFVAANSRQFLRSAWLLTGDWAGAEDLVQSTIAVAWRRWSTIEGLAQPEAYVRRILVNLFISSRRRQSATEISVGEIFGAAAHDDLADTEMRLVLLKALAGLPKKQRAVIVLRYFNDLSIEQVAEILGCTSGTVKSQSSRALSKLRSVPALAPSFEESI
jgi:RNA polymerase sigma-70 factor (sigma-E family)